MASLQRAANKQCKRSLATRMRYQCPASGETSFSFLICRNDNSDNLLSNNVMMINGSIFFRIYFRAFLFSEAGRTSAPFESRLTVFADCTSLSHLDRLLNYRQLVYYFPRNHLDHRSLGQTQPRASPGSRGAHFEHKRALENLMKVCLGK